MTKFDWIICFVLFETFVICFLVGLVVATWYVSRGVRKEVEKYLASLRR